MAVVVSMVACPAGCGALLPVPVDVTLPLDGLGVPVVAVEPDLRGVWSHLVDHGGPAVTESDAP